MSDCTKFYITHLVADELPDSGYLKLFFYTTTDEGHRKGEYFWGTDNNSFSREEMRDKEDRGVIIPLPMPIKLEDKKGLWVDASGTVYLADLINPVKGAGGLGEPIFRPRALTKPFIAFKKIKDQISPVHGKESLTEIARRPETQAQSHRLIGQGSPE